jgi:hypothetical protein
MHARKYSYLASGKIDDAYIETEIIGIGKDIRELSFPDSMKLDANILYLSLKLGQKRGRKRKMAITFCIYQVYLNEGLYYDIIHIGKMLGLTESDSMKSISAYSKALANARMTKENHRGIVDPMAMILYYCGPDVLGLGESDLEEVKELYIQTGDFIQNFSKKLFIAAVVYYWMTQKALVFDQTLYMRAFPGITMKRIQAVYNQLYMELNK